MSDEAEAALGDVDRRSAACYAEMEFYAQRIRDLASDLASDGEEAGEVERSLDEGLEVCELIEAEDGVVLEVVEEEPSLSVPLANLQRRL